LAGPLTLKTLFEFQQKAREDSDHAIILDLGGVPYADSAGLGAMLGVLASCQRQGKEFAVASPGERIQTLFRLTRVDGLVHAHKTVDEAVQDMQKRASR
jgi:anti-anti-sigma factor